MRLISNDLSVLMAIFDTCALNIRSDSEFDQPVSEM
jgi:hypothetical protein